MYIVIIYEEDFSDKHGKHLVQVGRLKGKFLSESDAKLKIDSENSWSKKNFIYRIVEAH